MRLIDADAIVYESIDSWDTGRYERYYGTGIPAVRKEDIDEMPTIEPKQGEWIPCEESLPEEEGRYLCTVNTELHQVRDMLYKPTSWGDEHRCKWKLQEGCYAYDWFVLAWMPLPEPYQEVANEL